MGTSADKPEKGVLQCPWFDIPLPAVGSSADKAKKGGVLRRWLDFIFGFKNKKGEVLSSWLIPVDGLSFSPKEFYASVEQQLAARKIPSMKITRQRFAEGGLLSDQRVYLRLMRERLAIDTCAAPFGNIFFFSCRTVYVPALVRLWHILAAICFFNLVSNLLVMALGLTYGSVALIALIFAVAGVLRNASVEEFSDLDAVLLRIPVVATLYENWFRQDTYYRQDTRSIYMQVLPDLIKELAENACATKGVKLDQQFQRKPSIVDLKKPLPPDIELPAI